MSKIIGIDLGTTNSVVAVMQGGEPVVIPQPGRHTHHASPSGHHQVRRTTGRAGGQAPGWWTIPENTVYSIKAFHGAAAMTK